MQIPSFLEFQEDCETRLRLAMTAVSPREGCALLLGNKRKTTECNKNICWEIHLIWPCSNVWNPVTNKLFGHKSGGIHQDSLKNSQQNRFIFNPADQIAAQKAARSKGLQVLGTAHSHPKGEAIPSETDKAWLTSTGLMLIVDGKGDMRAWWMVNNVTVKPLEVPCLNSR